MENVNVRAANERRKKLLFKSSKRQSFSGEETQSEKGNFGFFPVGFSANFDCFSMGFQ